MHLAQEHLALLRDRGSLAHPILERVARQALLSDVRARADEAGEAPVLLEARRALIQDPAVLAVVAPEPVLHAEAPPRDERVEIRGHAALEVLGVDAARPAAAPLFIERPAGE